MCWGNMIHPDKIGTEAKKKEEENFKFRSYLKGHADEKELDEQFLQLHKELFADYDCSKCRNCCKLEDCKPDSCKKYPYTDQPERLWSLLGMLDTIAICPVAFEIFESLKKEYGFKRR